MNSRTFVVFLTLVMLLVLLCAVFLCACTDESLPPPNTPDEKKEVTDPWYTKGYTKGEVRSEDVLRDLFSSLFNPIKSISENGRLNSSNPEFTTELNLNLTINKSPAKCEIIINWNINDVSKRAASLKIFKGTLNEEVLNIIIHPTESLNADHFDMFIMLKGSNVDTKLVTEIQSDKFSSLFPLGLSGNFTSTVDGLPGMLNSVLKLSTDKIKYEYKNEGSSLLRRYDIKIDLRLTLVELMNNVTLLDVAQRKNVEFFLDNLLGTTSSNKQFINTMPPADLEIEFETKKVGNESNIKHLSLNFAVSRDEKTQGNNSRFNGEPYVARLTFEKFSVVYGSSIGLSKITSKDSLLESSNIADMENGKYFRYDMQAPISLLFKGKYVGEYGSNDYLNPSRFMLGLKAEATGGERIENEELYFKIFNSENTSFSFKYTNHYVTISGSNIEEFGFPFNMQELINGIIATREEDAMITTEDRMFKIITFLVGALKIVENDVFSLEINLTYLLDVIALNTDRLDGVMQAAYVAAGGDGPFKNVLSDNWKPIQSILSTDSFILELDLTEDYFSGVDSLETEFE